MSGRVNILEMKKQTEARGQIDQGGDTENDPEMRTSVCRADAISLLGFSRPSAVSKSLSLFVKSERMIK